MERVEWLVTHEKQMTPVVCDFKELYGLRESLWTLTLLFDTNSYHVNAIKRLFIVNGGRFITFPEFKNIDTLKVDYVRRMRVSTDDLTNIGTEYYIGLKGDLKGEPISMYLRISQDGTLWEFRKTR